MSFFINRRALLATAGFGIGGLMLPGGAAMAQALLGLAGFTHNVASGEPGPDSVLLWTRYVNPTGGPSKVRVTTHSAAAGAARPRRATMRGASDTNEAKSKSIAIGLADPAR